MLILKKPEISFYGRAAEVGTFAVQLTRWRGRAITTGSAANIGFLRKLGVDEVIDYTRNRFDAELYNVDVVLDTAGGATVDRSWQVLRNKAS